MLKKGRYGPLLAIRQDKEIRGERTMKIGATSIEIAGTIDTDHNLILDEPLPIAGPKRVRVLILMNAEGELGEDEWLKTASKNPAFAFLHDPEEDVYSVNDGRPFDAEG